MSNNHGKQYILWFAHEHVDFRDAEIESILNMYNIKLQVISKQEIHPYWIVELESEENIHIIAKRSVSLRFCLELWGTGQNIDELHKNLKTYPREKMTSYITADKSFKIIVETFCKHFSQEEKVNKIETFNYLPLAGPVKLKNPDTTLFYIEFYGLDPNDIPETPYELFFGRWVTDGQRDLIQKLSLKTRKFIGNTSMDPQLSLLMANQAQVKDGDIVLDPFVGSGSLLVAAAYFKGYTLGTDIDFLMLHARTRPTRISQKERSNDESIAANMKQYGINGNHVDVLVADFSRPLWKDDLRIDAIITDPPYGIRESTERVGSMKINPVIEEHQAASHIPSKIDYGLSNIFRDLLNFSAKHLKIDGRLVCWFPVYRDNYSRDQLPQHSCLELVSNSEQILSNYTSRRLLTYKKSKEPEEADFILATAITDFREKYFALRDETRKVRRMRKAEERAKNKEFWEKNCKNSSER